MNKKHLLLAVLAISTLSCNNDNNSRDTDANEVTTTSKYIITATPDATQGVADYLITADNLTTGSVSTIGNGIEQDGTWRYYVTHNNKFYSLLYGQGNPGAVTAYNLTSDGKLNKITNFQSETMASFGVVQNDVLMFKISRSNTNPTANWYRLGTNENYIVAEGNIDQKALANKPDGEIAYFIMPKQVGNKVFLPYFNIYGDRTKGLFSTAYPDEANIAVYSYPNMTYERTITTNKMSHIGRYFTDGLSVDETGDVYAYSASIAMGDAQSTLSSTKPSAIMRVKKDATSFDNNYFFNIEQATNNEYYLTEWVYTKNGKALGYFNKKENKGAYTRGKKMGVIDLYNQTITWVNGLPNEADIVDNTRDVQTYVSDDKNTVSLGIITAEGSFVYNINIPSAQATKGLKVEGGKITGISRISYSK